MLTKEMSKEELLNQIAIRDQVIDNACEREKASNALILTLLGYMDSLSSIAYTSNKINKRLFNELKSYSDTIRETISTAKGLKEFIY